MALTQQALRYGQRRAARRLSRSVPFIGTALALLAIGAAIRRKGVVGGTVDSILNAVPFVGGVKVLAEMARGRDFIGDRPMRPTRPVA
jgi:hypothetical protein